MNSHLERTWVTIAVFLVGVLPASDQIPAPPQSHPILLKGATIHPVSTGPLANGQILFDDGVITAVGKAIDSLPDDTEIIDLRTKHVYPGLIAASTTLGLLEINAVRATRDFAETGTVNPNIRAEVSFNPDSELIPVTRSNGVTLVHTTPTGGLISGLSAAMMLDGWTWETATLKAPVALHLNWPRMTLTVRPGIDKSLDDQRKERDERLRRIDEVFHKARSYLQAREAAEREDAPHHALDLKWEAMIPVLTRQIPVCVHANEVQQIEAAVAWSQRQQVRLIIVGGRDAWRVKDLLKEYGIPVIYESVHTLPLRPFEPYDTPFATPWRLYKAGIPFCLAASSSPFQAPHQRNLPYHAATAAAYGLPRDEALRSITLYAARILGIQDRVGSLEVGKDATLIVTDGDPLEIPTQVEMEFIQGKRIDLGDRHKTLYRKYQEKYRQAGILK
ncbi:MAG: amidohydrolase family protein [Fidelibacterota bacterium]